MKDAKKRQKLENEYVQIYKQRMEQSTRIKYGGLNNKKKERNVQQIKKNTNKAKHEVRISKGMDKRLSNKSVEIM